MKTKRVRKYRYLKPNEIMHHGDEVLTRTKPHQINYIIHHYNGERRSFLQIGGTTLPIVRRLIKQQEGAE